MYVILVAANRRVRKIKTTLNFLIISKIYKSNSHRVEKNSTYIARNSFTQNIKYENLESTGQHI